MNVNGFAGRMSRKEIDKVHQSALAIVADVGLKIENDALLQRLADFGGNVDTGSQVVTFSRQFVERFIAESAPYDWANHQPRVGARAGIYEGRFLDPSGRYLEWTEDLVAAYSNLAQQLEHVEHAHMLGCPIKGVDRRIIPLYQRYICWKYGMNTGASIWALRLCPFLVEMAQIMADATGHDAKDYLPLCVYLISPLRFSREEAEQFMWFVERGHFVDISHMASLGGNAPVTLAGAVSLYLAESIITNIIRRAIFGETTLRLGCSISALDMRTGSFTYGRPEKALANVIMAQMARFYKASFTAQAGNSDAKKPGYESAAQKVMLALPAIIYGAPVNINAGLISTDEVCSPTQMILDNEVVGALKRFVRGCGFEDEDFGLELIKEVGPGGVFTDQPHTASHFREELWSPRLWSGELLSGWLAGDKKTAIDKANDLYSDISSGPRMDAQIAPETEKALLQVMDKARAALA